MYTIHYILHTIYGYTFKLFVNLTNLMCNPPKASLVSSFWRHLGHLWASTRAPTQHRPRPSFQATFWATFAHFTYPATHTPAGHKFLPTMLPGMFQQTVYCRLCVDLPQVRVSQGVLISHPHLRASH